MYSSTRLSASNILTSTEEGGLGDTCNVHIVCYRTAFDIGAKLTINQRHMLRRSSAFRIPHLIYNFGSFPHATLTDPMVAKWEGATGSFYTYPPSCTYAVTKCPSIAVSSVAHEQVGTYMHTLSKARPMTPFWGPLQGVHFGSIAKLPKTHWP